MLIDAQGSDLAVYERARLLVATGRAVLHGSPRRDGPLAELVPQPAYDEGKPDGNRVAVYATLVVDVAFLHGCLDRHGLAERFGSVDFGYRFDRGRFVLRLSEKAFRLARDRPDELWTDGFVYVVDRRRFTHTGGSEHWCESPVVPAAAFPVSRRWALRTFGPDGRAAAASIEPYPH